MFLLVFSVVRLTRARTLAVQLPFFTPTRRPCRAVFSRASAPRLPRKRAKALSYPGSAPNPRVLCSLPSPSQSRRRLQTRQCADPRANLAHMRHKVSKFHSAFHEIAPRAARHRVGACVVLVVPHTVDADPLRRAAVQARLLQNSRNVGTSQLDRLVAPRRLDAHIAEQPELEAANHRRLANVRAARAQRDKVRLGGLCPVVLLERLEVAQDL